MTEQPFILKITRKWTSPLPREIPMTDIIYALVANDISIVKMERFKKNKPIKFEDEISFADDVLQYVIAYLEGKKIRALDGEEHRIEKIYGQNIIAKYLLLKE